MKKYILFLFLFSSVVFAQPKVDDYENDFLSLNTIGNYPNFYQELVLSDFIYGDFQNPSNEVIGFIAISNNILSVNISKTWPQQGLRLGTVKHLDIYPILPNIELGPILSVGAGAQTGYFAKIVNNDIIIYSPYFPEKLSTAGQIPISYAETMELPFISAGGSGNIIIGQNKIFFEYNNEGLDLNSNMGGVIYTFPEWYPYNGLGGFASRKASSSGRSSFDGEIYPVDPGQISFRIDIPDTDLGVLQNNGQNTIYKGKIENEQIIIYTTENLPPVPSGGALAFVYDLSTLSAPRWYKDEDGDGYGSPNNTATGTAAPPIGYVANNADCDDSNAAINPTTVWYQDQDLDGYGSINQATITGCLKPLGYAIRSGDCNDNDATLSPDTVWFKNSNNPNVLYPVITSCYQPSGYTDHYSPVGTGPGSLPIACVDGNNMLNPETVWYYDGDADGYGNNVDIVKSCTQPANYVSNNLDCNDHDASLNPNTVWYQDHDGDTYGSPASTASGCTQPVGYVGNATDYNDGTVNITNIPPQTFYRDADGDTFGDPGVWVFYSIMPPGYVTNNMDCNDTDNSINPNTIWHRDADGDGYGTSTITVASCTQPAGYVRNAADYNDGTINITNIVPQTFYLDGDGDGFGNPNSNIYYSVKPVGYVLNNTDCNDTDSSINPNTVWYRDADGDSYGTSTITAVSCTQPIGYVYNAADYDDTIANITNIAPQTFYRDADGDTFGNPNVSVYYSIKPIGYVINNTDCNDGVSSLNPNTKWYADNDADGLGDPSNYVQQCTAPVGNYVLNNTDNCPLVPGTNPDCSSLSSPSLDHNYIITKTYKQPRTTAFTSPTIEQAQIDITYFDGLGRPIQQIANRQSASGKDIISYIGYDNFGRQDKGYLPYMGLSTNMAYEENAEQGTKDFYMKDQYDSTTNPFSEKVFEPSPLNRIVKQAAPGDSWKMGKGHEIKIDYQNNTDADAVISYRVTANWQADTGLYDISLGEPGSYGEGKLYKTVTYDENTTASPSESSGSTVEFKNKEGQVILKRTYDSGNPHDTYYVYDIYGNLTYVIPPKVAGVVNREVLDGLCYQYKYDNRNRVVEKKLPGKQWEFIVYDKLNRPVASGPVFSPFKNETVEGWLITKYDAFSRPIYTGWSNQSSNSVTRKSLQDAQNAATILFETMDYSGIIDDIEVYYSNNIAPTNFKLLTVTYYDDYAFPNVSGRPAIIDGQGALSDAKSLVVGSWARALTTASETFGETTTTFYDARARVVSTRIKNHLGGYSNTDSSLDFTGKPLYTITKHKRRSTDTDLTIREEYTYSPQDRLLTHTHQINGGGVQLLADNTYDDLGQLILKNVGNSFGAPLQEINYSYNIRGWLTGINNIENLQQNSGSTDLFAFKINYDKQPANAQVQELYNGNISETYWRTANDLSTRFYGYQYDNLNRLTNAIYGKQGDAIPISGAYNESLSYDKNGNIKFLQRYGGSDAPSIVFQIDDLTYGYLNESSNQLTKVTDSPAGNNNEGFIDANKTGDDFAYDANGNMIADKNKNITEILYNHLNLPKKITFGTTLAIEYIYNATGQKLEKIVKGYYDKVTRTNYLGGFQYSFSDSADKLPTDPGNTDPPIDSTDPFINPPAEANRLGALGGQSGSQNIPSRPALQFFPTVEGYYDNLNQKYVYQYKDHLGNVRLSYAKNPVTQVLEIIEEDNYYPFGLKHEGYNTGSKQSGYNYKFSGKELQDELGLNMYDYGARNYDPALGRWNVIDEKAEKYSGVSPYVYSSNNPTLFVDPDGKDVYITIGNKPVGTTSIRLIGTNGEAPRQVQVALYEMKVTDDVTGKTTTYQVTRDAPVLNSKDPVNEANGVLEFFGLDEDTYNVDNTAFEPAEGDGNYIGIALGYPEGTDLEAIALRNPDGSNKLDAVENKSPERKKGEENVARGVMIHVGGQYVKDGKSRLVGSFGCFGIAGKNAGNKGAKKFINDIVKRLEKNRKAKKGDDINIKLKKRNDVDWEWEVGEDGEKVD